MVRILIFLITAFQIHVTSVSAAVLLFDDFDGTSGGVPPGWVQHTGPNGSPGIVEDLAGSVVRITSVDGLSSTSLERRAAPFDPSGGIRAQAVFTSITSSAHIAIDSPNFSSAPGGSEFAILEIGPTGSLDFIHAGTVSSLGSTTYSGGAITVTMELDADSLRVITSTGFNSDVPYSSLTGDPFTLSELGSSATLSLESFFSGEIVVDRVSVSSLEFEAVPEPSTAGLLAFGLSMLACRRRRVIPADSP